MSFNTIGEQASSLLSLFFLLLLIRIILSLTYKLHKHFSNMEGSSDNFY